MKRFPWANWTDERLMQLRIKDLGVRLEGTWIADCVDELHGELGERGLRLKPHVWVSDEWFSPGRRARVRRAVLPRSTRVS